MSSDIGPRNCQSLTVCPPMYEVFSNIGTKKINVVSHTNIIGLASYCDELLLEENWLSYNPCPDNATSCCKETNGTTETYSPVNNRAVCESTCQEWSMSNVEGTPSQKLWTYKEIKIADGETCPTPPIDFSNVSYYKHHDDYVGNSRCSLNEFPIFSKEDIKQECPGGTCDPGDFDKVTCTAPAYYAQVIDVISNQLSTLCTTQTPPISIDAKLSYVLDQSIYDKIELIEIYKNSLSNDLCKVYQLGVSNLKVVVGTEQSFPSAQELNTSGDLDGFFIVQLPTTLQPDTGEEYDDHYDTIITESVSNLLNPSDGTRYNYNSNEKFGKWEASHETGVDQYLSTEDYFILSGDLTQCDSFYQSGAIAELKNDSSDTTYDIVDFSIVRHPYVRKTCPIDPFYSNLAQPSTACTNNGTSIICCVSNYKTENSYYTPDTTSSHTLPKTCTENCTLSSSHKQISKGTGYYYCGDVKQPNCGNILDDQGSSSLINMYPGYDYQYINYASTTHKYFNGEHGSPTDTPICTS